MLCNVMICYAMLCNVMICYAMLCNVMICYAMLCLVTLLPFKLSVYIELSHTTHNIVGVITQYTIEQKQFQIKDSQINHISYEVLIE
jgi:hypothetical protein